MKIACRILLLIALSSQTLFGQTALWSENFDNNFTGCNINSYPFAWDSVLVGSQGSNANTWYISYPENSIGGVGCDTQNINTSKGALYIGYGGGCDSSLYGAVYKKGCDNNTSKLAVTPTINCSSATTAPILEFDYLTRPFHWEDYASVLFSQDNGANWDTLIQRLNTGRCYRVINSGFWDHESITLPSFAIGNSSVRIAFAWTNDDNCVGTGISIAIDNIKIITGTCDLPITFGKGGTLQIPTELCVDNLINLGISSPTGSGFSYEWSVDGIVVSTTSAISEYLTLGDHIVSAYVYNESGECGLITQTVDVQPTFAVTASTSDNDICLNECIDFYATAMPSSSCYTYQWTFINAIPDGSNIQNPTGICFDNPYLSNGTVIVSCSTTVCQVTTTTDLYVNTCGHTYVTLIYHDGLNSICEGQSIQFHSNATDATSYYWSFPGGTPSSSTLPEPTITYNANTIGIPDYDYSLIVTNSYNTDTIWSSVSTNLNVAPSPAIPSLMSTSITGGTLLTITNSSAYTFPPETLKWYSNTGSWNYISNDNNFTYTATISTPTLYKVEVSNSYSCISVGTITAP